MFLNNPIDYLGKEAIPFLQERHLQFLRLIFSYFNLEGRVEQQFSFKDLSYLLKKHHKQEVVRLSHATLSKNLNQIIWNYLELIEGNIVELFEQINRANVNFWNEIFLDNLTAITFMLKDYLAELNLLIDVLEDLLKEQKTLPYTSNSPFYWLSHFFFKRKTFIDNQIRVNIKNSQTFLIIQFSSLQAKVNKTIIEKYKIAKEVKSLKKQISLSQMDKSEREHFLNFYKSLMLWNFVIQNKIISKQDFWKYFDFTYPPKKIIELLLNYNQGLFNSFYRLCQEWRETHDIKIIEKMELLAQERLLLENILHKYRSMLLFLNPNPYISTKLGFSEYVVGMEPTHSLHLKEILFSLADLKKIMQRFNENLIKQTLEDSGTKYNRLKQAIELLTHQMGQPLMSRKAIAVLMDKMLILLEELDELGGSAGDVGALITAALLTLLNYDWSYQILYEHERFKELYQIHLQLEKKGENFVQENQLRKIKGRLNELKSLLKQSDPFKIINDAESSLTEISALLQAFFYATKIAWETADEMEKILLAEKIKLDLLEHYALFSHFLGFLSKNEPNGKLFLNSFFTVKQYLDATLQIINSKKIYPV